MNATLAPVSVVVPVYDAVADLRRCVDAVLACTTGDYRLVLIDDASPDPAIRAYWAELGARALPHVTLLANERNLGFTGTSNRGFALADGDVVLLNSDAVVTRGWLDALARCVASDPRIGTATPFSNNAEILSFPRFCEDNRWPDSADPEPVRAAMAQAAVPTYPELPTGVGFCLYVRRALLDAIGPFDEAAFGAGYGEENDLCMRAIDAGWRNVLCDDAFVLHTGERSFSGRRAELVARNMQVLLSRHPDYMDLVRSFIAADPLAALRAAALARLAIAEVPSRGTLHLAPEPEASACRQRVRSEVERGGERMRHYVATIGDAAWCIEMRGHGGATPTATFAPVPGESMPDFVGGVVATFAIDRVRWHGVDAPPPALVDALGFAPTAGGQAADLGARAVPRSPAFSPIRVRDAFGYRPWTVAGARETARGVAAPVAAPARDASPLPPAPTVLAGEDPVASRSEPNPKPLAGVLATAALRLRATAVGRVVARLVPPTWRAALRARLR